MSTTFLQQILSSIFLFAVNYLVDKKVILVISFKLKPVTTYHIRFVMKVL